MFEKCIAVKVVCKRGFILVHGDVRDADGKLVLYCGQRIGEFKVIDDELLEISVLNHQIFHDDYVTHFIDTVLTCVGEPFNTKIVPQLLHLKKQSESFGQVDQFMFLLD